MKRGSGAGVVVAGSSATARRHSQPAWGQPACTPLAAAGRMPALLHLSVMATFLHLIDGHLPSFPAACMAFHLLILILRQCLVPPACPQVLSRRINWLKSIREWQSEFVGTLTGACHVACSTCNTVL